MRLCTVAFGNARGRGPNEDRHHPGFGKSVPKMHPAVPHELERPHKQGREARAPDGQLLGRSCQNDHTQRSGGDAELLERPLRRGDRGGGSAAEDEPLERPFHFPDAESFLDAERQAGRGRWR